MDKKTVQSYRRRINKTQGSLGCMGEMLLIMDLESMSINELRQLQAALLDSRKPLSYPKLDQMVEKEC